LGKCINHTSAKSLLQLIPEDAFAAIAADTQVDYQVKKLYGKSMFYLLLYGLLESSRTSLRSMEDVFNSQKFKVLFNLNREATTKYNSISDRLATMNMEFFRQTYELLYLEFSKRYGKEDGLKYNITRVDSTMVVEAAAKLEAGMVVGTRKATGPKQVKYTVSLTNLLPSSVEVYTAQQYLSEDMAIPQAVLNHVDRSRDNVFVFDRGVASRKAFNTLDSEGLQFVTRVNPNARYRVVESTSIPVAASLGSLTLFKDDRVVLFDKNHAPSSIFRLLQTAYEKGKPYWFLTNLLDDDPAEVVEMYRRRWDIEVFFRFIKQELSFKHFVLTSVNGIMIMLYVTLILAMLVLMYKKANELGYKTAKRRFNMEVEEVYLALIIQLSGGDPSLVFR